MEKDYKKKSGFFKSLLTKIIIIAFIQIIAAIVSIVFPLSLFVDIAIIVFLKIKNSDLVNFLKMLIQYLKIL